ncbi:hypothetical protein HYU14_04580 [Candidatus Woesearchaeota archaeon]|nr:hypothetical protein [Candidatus Woesearchaeota archaeon]
MKTVKKSALCLLVAVVLFQIAFAFDLGAQSIPSINLDDDVITSAEQELLISELSKVTSLPGEVLYPVKKFKESMQSFFVKDARVEASLHLTFAKERLREAFQLQQKSRAKESEKILVEFKEEIDRYNQLSQENSSETLRQKGKPLQYYKALQEAQAGNSSGKGRKDGGAVEISKRGQKGSIEIISQAITGSKPISEKAGLKITSEESAGKISGKNNSHSGERDSVKPLNIGNLTQTYRSRNGSEPGATDGREDEDKEDDEDEDGEGGENESKIGSNHSSKLSSNISSKLGSKLDSKIGSNISNNLDSMDSNLGSNLESKIDNKSGSEIDNTIDSQIDGGNQSIGQEELTGLIDSLRAPLPTAP